MGRSALSCSAAASVYKLPTPNKRRYASRIWRPSVTPIRGIAVESYLIPRSLTVMSSSPSTYKLLTCTRYDPFLLSLNWNNDSDGTPSPFLLLRFHVDRLVDAAERHAWAAAKAAISLDTVKATCQGLVDNAAEFESQPLKVILFPSVVTIINISIITDSVTP